MARRSWRNDGKYKFRRNLKRQQRRESWIQNRIGKVKTWKVVARKEKEKGRRIKEYYYWRRTKEISFIATEENWIGKYQKIKFDLATVGQGIWS